MAFHYPINGGSGGSGVTSLNSLTGALNLVEGSGINIDSSGSDITISALGSSVDNTTLEVKVATTAVLPGSPVYANGTGGVGATLTRGTNGTLGTIDGVTVANLMVGDRILVKNQASQLQNGIYEITATGSASAPYVLTRTTDADTTAEMDDMVAVASLGTANKGIPFGQQTNNPTIGTNNIVFTSTGIYMKQQSSGTQTANQIPVYTGTAMTLTKGTSAFKYNPTTNVFTVRGIDYLFPSNDGDASQVLTTDGSGNLSWTTVAGGSPGGSQYSVQVNDGSSGFYGDDDFIWNYTYKIFGVGDLTQTGNHVWQELNDLNGHYLLHGFKNEIPAHTTTPIFTGSGTDNIVVDGTPYSGTGTTSYSVTIDGINQDLVSMPTSSISGSGFQIGETLTSTSGGSATIVSVSLGYNNSYTYIILSGTTGTFLQYDTITGTTSGTTATIDSDLGQQDTYSWTDGTNSGANIPCKINPNTALSYDVGVNFDNGTGHTLSDNWTFDGVPAVTDYGRFFDFDQNTGTLQMGDVDGISGYNRAYFTLNSLNGTSGILAKSFRLRTPSGETYFVADTSTSVYSLGALGFGNNTNINIFDSANTIDATGTFTATKSFTSSISPVQFSGSGLDDMTVSGTYTGTTSARYDVVIDIEGTPDAFNWSKNGVLQATDVPITGSPQLLDDGVYVTFGSTTGHTKPDQWTFTGIQFNDAILTNNYDLGSFFGSTVTLNGQISSFDNKLFFSGIEQDATGIETSANMGVVDLTNDIQSYVSASLDRTNMLYYSSSASYLIELKDTGMRLFGGTNQTGITIDDITKTLTLQSDGTFVLQNPATTVFMGIDTVNGNAQFGGQSWRTGLFAENTTGRTVIGDWSSSYNKTKVVVSDLERTVTLIGGIITPVIQGLDYGDTATASRGVASIMVGSAGTGTTTINLDGTYDIGQEFQIFDRGYGAGSNNIVVDAGTGNVLIQKGVAPAQTFTIATNGESIIIKKVSTNEWMIIATN